MKTLEHLVLYVVEEFVTAATAGLSIQPEDRHLLIRYYKCTIIGVCLDWLDAGMEYDLLAASVRSATCLPAPRNGLFSKEPGKRTACRFNCPHAWPPAASRKAACRGFLRRALAPRRFPQYNLREKSPAARADRKRGALPCYTEQQNI